MTGIVLSLTLVVREPDLSGNRNMFGGRTLNVHSQYARIPIKDGDMAMMPF